MSLKSDIVMISRIIMKILEKRMKIRAVAGQRSSPDLCFVTKSMTHDIDLKVTQVGQDGTA